MKQTRLLLVTLVFLAGCASSGGEIQKIVIDPLEQNAIYAVQLANKEEAAEALQLALEQYQRNDDVYGQWRVHYLSAKYALAHEDSPAVTDHVTAMKRLASQLDNRYVQYRTHLLAGILNNDQGQFSKALTFANSNLQKAVALTYLGQSRQAIDLLDNADQDHPADRAFVHYRYAQQGNSSTPYEQALGYYQAAKDPRGVADSLVSLARLASAQGQTTTAQQYAERAVNVLRSSGNETKAIAISNWLTSLR